MRRTLVLSLQRLRSPASPAGRLRRTPGESDLSVDPVGSVSPKVGGKEEEQCASCFSSPSSAE